MDGCMRQIGDSYIIKSTCITIGKDKIGTGNFADVYKGTYKRDKEERIVAVKIVRVGGGNVGTELHCLAELKNEALIMSLHRHRHVIEFHGISSDKIPMILMEYCAGGSLELHLQNRKERILNSERVNYMFEISDGMRYLERKQCVHRDLAARNVLISTSGNLKISDFGLSRSPLVAPPKETSQAHLPIRWMAPESLTRTPVYSIKSDVWSFGVVVYEIFNYGQKPWPEKPVKWIATKIRKGITTDMPKRMPRLIREIVHSCFQYESEQRPTFRQLNSRIRLVQGIRFPPLHPRTSTLARLKNVKPFRITEKDPEATAIESDDVKESDEEEKKDIYQDITDMNKLIERTKEERTIQRDGKKKANVSSSDDDYESKITGNSVDTKISPDNKERQKPKGKMD